MIWMRIVATVALLLGLSQSAVAVGEVQVLALTGTDGALGPQLGEGVEFNEIFNLSPPVIDATGTVYSWQQFGTAAETYGEGFWRMRAGHSPAPLAMTGTSGAAGPGLGAGVVFHQIGVDNRTPRTSSALSDSGVFSFLPWRVPRRVGPKRGEFGALHGEAPTPVVLSGTEEEYGPALGDGIQFKAQFGALNNTPLQIDEGGGLHFSADLEGEGVAPGTEKGVFVAPVEGPPMLLARSGVSGRYGPGLGDGVHFVPNATLGEFDSTLNAAGQSALEWRIEGAGVDDSNNVGIWLTAPSSPPRLVARTGDDSLYGPNLGSGFHFDRLHLYGLDQAGAPFVYGRVIGADGEAFSVLGKAGDSGFEPMLQMQTDGVLGPNLGEGTVFASTSPLTVLDDGSAVIFGTVSGPISGFGIWTAAPGSSPVPIAVEGVPTNADIDPDVLSTFFPAFTDRISESGLIMASVSDAWLLRGDSLLRITDSIDLIDIDPTDGVALYRFSEKVFQADPFRYQQDGTAINPSGLFTFSTTLSSRAPFDRRAGVFLVDTRVVPEPGSLTLLALAGGAMLIVRRGFAVQLSRTL